ncbi:tyrosine-type recombinase/integrase [Halorussus aquaticus]|uniref:Tyrosine-type recombinase/integrase n=1 Tax=Halorussus aquaticus TaxID=2953748 RepID=A0ABD5Q955_9EURY|nr:tyrosine-type recombinase/integrase [Halorussus aquaticus]
MSETINWSHHDLDALKELYWDEIAPALRRDGRDPHTRPSYETLADLGYSGIGYTLREHHDLTVKEFLTDVVGLEDSTVSGESPDDYAWQISSTKTIDEFEAYLRALDRRRKLADSTLASKRTHLATYAQIYEDLHGTSDLLTPLSDPSEQAAETERAYQVVEVLDDKLATDGTKFTYVGTVQGWYDRLDRHGAAAYNPLDGVTTDFGWERAEPDNKALSPSDVRALNNEADTPADRLLLVALAAWGLRSGEVARLHVNQFVGIDSDDPHLEFEERKNGPSTVSLLYGLDAYQERQRELVDDYDEWNGYLFPSAQAETGHIDSDTVRNRFHRLAEQADVRIDGGLPKPHMARRFWYSQYQDALADVLDRLDIIADEQGSSSADVVHQNYLSEEKRREARRPAMRELLADAFGA